MATLQDIIDDLKVEATAIAGVSTLIDGLRTQVADLLSGVTLPPGVQQQIDDVFAQAEANKVAITDAMAENVPVPDTAPTPDPVP